MTIELSEREWTAIVGALRHQEESHKRNDFKALVLEMQEIRSRLNDVYIDSKAVVV